MRRDRFSFVIVEENLLNGNLEDVTIEGVTDVLKKLEKNRKQCFFYSMSAPFFWDVTWNWCMENWKHAFRRSCSYAVIWIRSCRSMELRRIRNYAKAMYDPLTAGYIDKKTVTLVGSDFVLDKNSDIKRLLKNKGIHVKRNPGMQKLGRIPVSWCRRIFISCYPPAKYGAEMLAERLNRKHLYLPGSFDYRKLKKN